MKVIRAEQVQTILGISPATFYRLIREEATFPRKVRLSSRAVGWIAEEVSAWIESRKETAHG